MEQGRWEVERDALRWKFGGGGGTVSYESIAASRSVGIGQCYDDAWAALVALVERPELPETLCADVAARASSPASVEFMCEDVNAWTAYGFPVVARIVEPPQPKTRMVKAEDVRRGMRVVVEWEEGDDAVEVGAVTLDSMAHLIDTTGGVIESFFLADDVRVLVPDDEGGE